MILSWNTRLQFALTTVLLIFGDVPGTQPSPWNLRASDITSHSVVLTWTVEPYTGVPQQFIVMKVIKENAFIQISDWINDTSASPGVEHDVVYTLGLLEPGTEYSLSVLARNDTGMSKLATPYVNFTTKGAEKDSPQAPINLRAIDIAYDSVTLQWTPGDDMGSPQSFIVMRKILVSDFIQFSDWIPDTSSGHQDITYTLTRLQGNTNYTLSVAARNDNGMSQLASPFVTFITPGTQKGGMSKHTAIVIGSVLGAFGFVAVMALVTYLVKYRKLRTNYREMHGSTVHPT